MSDRNCPHCGYALADEASTCPCGLSLEDIDMPAPGIVRDSLEQKLTLSINDLEDIEVDLDEAAGERGSGERKRTPGSSGASPRDELGAGESTKDPEAEKRPEAILEQAGGRASQAHKTPAKAKATDKGQTLRAVREAGAGPRKNMIIPCPSCRASISKRAPRCPKCGQSPYRSCQICTALILVNSPSCAECGDPDPFLAQSA